ncbi:hypothetical protein ACFB49_19950 [Sphingomonas sp. DBB INV C78]|uniref:tetratricopeptide repeat protein n=1 Tax=Sphingomonas sp. DBB INV C78 TaxID=3349434 RepID=UPI0036D389EF
MRKAAVLLSVAMALMLGACESREERAAEAAARADQLLQQGNPIAAGIEIRKAIGERDDIASFWIILARSEMMQRSYANAFSSYLRAIELERGNLEALHAVAELAFAGGQLDDADRYADQLLALNTQNTRALLVKGSVALRRNKFADADDFVSKVLAIEPVNEGAILLRSRILSQQGKNAEGAALLEKALEERGDTPMTLSGLLEIYQKAKDSPNIARTYARLFKIAPENMKLQLDYARELYASGDMQTGYAVISKVQQARPDDPVLQGLIVDTWLAAGGEAVSPEEVNRIASDGSPTMKVALARYVLEKGRPAEAERILQPFVADAAIASANVEAQVIYAMAKAALGQRGDALRRANAILDFDNTNSRALMLRARIEIADKSADQALADAQILVRDNPDLAAARIVLADVYVLRKQPDLANVTYQRAIGDFPVSIEILGAYLDYLVAADRRPDALRAAVTFTRRNPDMVPGWKTLGVLCLRLGEKDCVRASIAALKGLRGGAAVASQLEAKLAANDREGNSLTAGTNLNGHKHIAARPPRRAGAAA